MQQKHLALDLPAAVFYRCSCTCQIADVFIGIDRVPRRRLGKGPFIHSRQKKIVVLLVAGRFRIQ